MSLRLLAAVLAVLGGGCWMARWLAGDPGWGAGAHVAGLVLLVLSLAAVGARLVSAVWLRAVVGLALPALVWSVYVVVRGEGDGVVLDGVAGSVAVLWGLLVLALVLRGRRRARAPRRRGGSHSR